MESGNAGLVRETTRVPTSRAMPFRHRGAAILRTFVFTETESALLQMFRYAIVGGCAAVVDIGSFSLFTTVLGIDYRIAVVLALGLGIPTNFVLSNAFVFNRRSLPLRVAFARIYVAAAGGLVVNELMMSIWVELLHLDNLVLGKMVATGTAFFVNFTLVRNYAFNHRVSLFRSFLRSSGTSAPLSPRSGTGASPTHDLQRGQGSMSEELQPIISEISRRRKLALLTSQLPAGCKVLEVGAGSGWLSRRLREAGYRVTTLDLVGPADVVGDILRWRELGLAPASFDAIVALEVIEHVDCLDALRSLCRPGGLIVLSSPHPRWDWVMRLLERFRLNQERTSAHTNLTDFATIPLEARVRRRPLLIHQVAVFVNKPAEPGAAPRRAREAEA